MYPRPAWLVISPKLARVLSKDNIQNTFFSIVFNE